ncbi:MAG: hypothetical protein Ct9H300mP3_11450 [Gammaproteobacteria bacterium]|nr:MAG: hypothetical protein Ct9H300mP3_11450 [Gammaproteobacteria bacterium]
MFTGIVEAKGLISKKNFPFPEGERLQIKIPKDLIRI